MGIEVAQTVTGGGPISAPGSTREAESTRNGTRARGWISMALLHVLSPREGLVAGPNMGGSGSTRALTRPGGRS